jgi:hypothetical protein
MSARRRPIALGPLLWLAATIAPASADEAGSTRKAAGRPAEVPWVVFRAPAFTGDRLPHGGPDWSFATPRLPALAADGRSLVVAKSELVLGGTPNLTLVVLRVSDLAVLSSLPILSVAEFAKAADISALDRAAAAFGDLAKRVADRMASASARLAAGRWTQLAACTVSPDADASQPPCARSEQDIACPGLALRFAGGALSGTWRGRSQRWGLGHARPAPVKDPNYGTIPVHSCFGSAWFDRSAGVFAGQLRHECQRGGDACLVQPTWQAKALR